MQRPMPQGIARRLRAYIEQGITAELIIFALEETAAAPYPSWRYLDAILSRCLACGVLTAEDWRKDHQQHRKKKRVTEQQYTQREYDPLDDGITPELLAEAKKYAQED